MSEWRRVVLLQWEQRAWLEPRAFRKSTVARTSSEALIPVDTISGSPVRARTSSRGRLVRSADATLAGTPNPSSARRSFIPGRA